MVVVDKAEEERVWERSEGDIEARRRFWKTGDGC